mgnify:CR=1 FL=1
MLLHPLASNSFAKEPAIITGAVKSRIVSLSKKGHLHDYYAN